MAGLELHEAAAVSDYDTLEEYLRSGKFDVNLKDEDWHNMTAMHWASTKGFGEGIRLLLEHGAKASSRTETGWTPAHCAAETGKLTSLRALHNANIPIDRKDKYGDTPLRIATIYNHKDCIKYLKQAEAELKERRDRLGIDDNSDDDYDDDDDRCRSGK
ncbi:ankyrin repeat domain-containing protein 66-like [Haliotis rufescens]|uniref:ankyrin repeat domain-containing protein 66-like n=1 Tax=Haliotis rufescens TaxID=6454 RepID=UPI00201E97A4|nr:ankyrin repeat domain-containing protein 66-like [Haliotis rufescens]